MNIGNIIKRHKRIIENFFSISLLNVVSHIISLFVIPYLLIVLGEEKYGAYLFIYTLALYIILVGTYGFRFSVTRQISIYRDNIQKINAIFNAAIFARLLLSAIASLLVGIAVYFLMDSDDMFMYILALGIVFGDVFIPTWLFQGMEEMRYLTISNVASKVVFAALIFVFIKEQSDYVYVLFLNSCGYIASGIISIVISFKHFGVRFEKPRKNDVIFLFKDGWHIFISNIGMELYRNSNVFLLGVMVGDAVVGIYGAIEKIIKVGQTIINALPMALFPYMSRFFNGTDIRENIVSLKKLMRVSFVLLLGISVVFAFSYGLIAMLYPKIDYELIRNLIWIMSPVLLFGCMNYIVGIVGLVNLNASKQFERNIWIAGIINVGIMLVFCKEYTYYAAATAWTLAETALFFLCLQSVNRIKDNQIKG